MLPWIVAACLALLAVAHHSTAEFDYTKQVTIKGTVKEVQWTNPHSYIQLMVDGEAGEKIQWSVEIGSPSLNINMGWRKNSVKVGDVVTMNSLARAQRQALRHAARAHLCRRTETRRRGGQSGRRAWRAAPRAAARRSGRRRSPDHAPPSTWRCCSASSAIAAWRIRRSAHRQRTRHSAGGAARHLGARRRTARAADFERQGAAAHRRGIEALCRTAPATCRGRCLIRSRRPGARARACPASSPCRIRSRSARTPTASRSSTAGIDGSAPSIWAAGTVDPPLPLTMGFPVGRWEGNTLVIRTAGLIDTTVLDASGLPHSEQLTLTERLRVLPDGRLEDRITIDDPETLHASLGNRAHLPSRCRGTRDGRCLPGSHGQRRAGGTGAFVEGKARRHAAAQRGQRRCNARCHCVALRRHMGAEDLRLHGAQCAAVRSAGQDIVGRNAAAMQGGRIMQTAWVSCRPGAVSTMTMPREKIVDPRIRR